MIAEPALCFTKTYAGIISAADYRCGPTTPWTGTESDRMSFARSDAYIIDCRPVNSDVRFLLFVKITPRKFSLAVIAIYLAAVIVCIAKAFDYAGAINFNWTLVVIALTLPWSLVSILFAWALIHGAGLEFFTFLYLAFAAINSAIFYAVCSRFRKPQRDDYFVAPPT